ncbi:MAG: hypothetical protein EXR05_00180 [Acetobacteraceae bacterium]|nr:hypothetical protein [Acetobacteraceae bacterium]
MVIVGAADPAHVVRALEEMIWDRFGPSRTPGAFFVVDTVPKNANGKIVRQALADGVRGTTPINL